MPVGAEARLDLGGAGKWVRIPDPFQLTVRWPDGVFRSMVSRTMPIRDIEAEASARARLSQGCSLRLVDRRDGVAWHESETVESANLWEWRQSATFHTACSISEDSTDWAQQ